MQPHTYHFRVSTKVSLEKFAIHPCNNHITVYLCKYYLWNWLDKPIPRRLDRAANRRESQQLAIISEMMNILNNFNQIEASLRRSTYTKNYNQLI